eukprot:scaffold1785_cov90-Skeletonema_marinoi.AAC.1
MNTKRVVLHIFTAPPQSFSSPVTSLHLSHLLPQFSPSCEVFVRLCVIYYPTLYIDLPLGIVDDRRSRLAIGKKLLLDQMVPEQCPSQSLLPSVNKEAYRRKS